MGNSKKILIILALVLVVVAVYFFFIYQPKADEIAKLNKRLSDVREEKKEKEVIANDLRRFEREVEQLNQNLTESLAQLPNEKEIPKILSTIAELTKSSGLELMTFTVNAEQNKGFYAAIPIDLELQGGYHNLAIFFDKVGKLKRIINLTNLKITKPVFAEGETKVTASCTATSFRFVSGSQLVETPPRPSPEKKPPEVKKEPGKETEEEAVDKKGKKKGK